MTLALVQWDLDTVHDKPLGLHIIITQAPLTVQTFLCGAPHLFYRTSVLMAS